MRRLLASVLCLAAAASAQAQPAAPASISDANRPPVEDVEVAFQRTNMGAAWRFSMHREGGVWRVSASDVFACTGPGAHVPPGDLAACAAVAGAVVAQSRGDSVLAVHPPSQAALQRLWDRLLALRIDSLSVPEDPPRFITLNGSCGEVSVRIGQRSQSLHVCRSEGEEAAVQMGDLQHAISSALGVLI